MPPQAQNISQIFLELGAAIVGLAVLACLANRLGFSAIPLYLLAGLAFGKGGLAPLNFSEHFIHTGAEIGLLLLLFMLGLEFAEQDRKHASPSSRFCLRPVVLLQVSGHFSFQFGVAAVDGAAQRRLNRLTFAYALQNPRQVRHAVSVADVLRRSQAFRVGHSGFG